MHYIVVTQEIYDFNQSLKFIGPELKQARVGLRLHRPQGSKKIRHSIQGILCRYDEELSELINVITRKIVIPVAYTEEFVKEI